MASRILYGAPSSKGTTDRRTTSTLPRPSASKRSQSGGNNGGAGGSTTAENTSSSSRLPQSAGTSFFGRHKGKSKEPRTEKPMTTSRPAEPTPSLEPAVLSPKRPSKIASSTTDARARMAAASSIPRGLAPGMGVTTRITGGSGSGIPAGTTSQPARSLRRRPSLTGAHDRYANDESSRVASSGREVPSRQDSVDASDDNEQGPAAVVPVTVSKPDGEDMYTSISKPDYSTPTEYQTSNSRMELYMSRRIPHKISTQNLPPPTINSHANTSSARDNSSIASSFRETPSPFSRISTPNTSSSSYSPQNLAPKLTPPRQRPAPSPTKSRPPVVRRKMPGGTPVDEYGFGQGLPSVRENREASNQSSSSSSNSTIKASDLMDSRTGRPTISGKLDRKPAPTAPLRISSKRLPRPPLAEAVSAAASRLEEPAQQISPASGERHQSRLPGSGLRSPPARPSRIGTARVIEPSESPVIQSNLSSVVTTGHTRRESMEQAIASPDRADSASPRRRLTKSPPKETASLVSSPQAVPRSSSRHRQIPSLLTDPPRLSKRDPSPASTSIASATRSRFGLFSRRIKSPEEPSSASVRKGPVAGTGHEAYGKFGRPTRGRSGSTSTSGSREKSASPSTRTVPKSRADSFTSNDGKSDKDDFFEQRLKPVVISGGGTIKSNRNSQSGPSNPVYASSSAQSSLASIGSSVIFNPRATVTSSESSASMVSTSAAEKHSSRSLLPAPKLTTKSDGISTHSLAHRRSQQRISHGEQTLRIPAPIDTTVVASGPVLDSRDTAQFSVPETGSSMADEPGEGQWLRSGSSKGKSRMKSPRRWNFFSRNRSRSPKKAATPVAPTSAPVQATQPVNVAVGGMQKAFVGHYALMDEEDISTDDRDLDDVLKDIENDLELRDENGGITVHHDEEEDDEEPQAVSRQVSMLLPSPPKLNAEFPRLQPLQPQLQGYPPEQIYIPETQPGLAVKRRPSRLQRIGRIPNQYTHRPNQSSFSRPFDASGRPSLEDMQPSAQIAESPSRPKLTLQTDRLPATTQVEQWRQAAYVTSPPTNAYLYNLDGEQEFMSMTAQRVTSQLSQSSSSGNTSFMNMLAGGHRRSSQQHHGDELWMESDDLTEGHDDFDLDSPEGEKLLNAFPSLSNVRRTSPSISPEDRDLSRPESEQSQRSKKSVSPPLPERPDHLNIPPHLHPATSGNNNNLLSEAFYDQRYLDDQRRNSVSSLSASRYSSQTTISSSSHVSAYVAAPINQVTQAMARKTHSARDSLRFSALMTSRWLSFDRVLFSPVAEDILSLSIQSPRILILDGLANDDWSAYTALSYPNATVYNLSTTPKLRTPSPHGDEWANPPNHKLLPLPSTAHPFPFPKGFFAAVVVRFPPLLPQHHLNNVIAEAKRVLRPGGYLEMTLLDIDPINLGPKTRREVKRVKMLAQQRMPDAGLAPVGDATMKLLGRRGFEGLRHAVLGVPVATAPDDDSIEGPGSLPFNEERANDSNAGRPSRSLGDLLREAGDESGSGISSQYPVTRTVSRVARWWWSRCYEGLASVDGNDERGTLLGLRGRGEEDSRSMWADPAVVSECEERGTNLRLVLAYAVKPMVVRRRTVSM